MKRHHRIVEIPEAASTKKWMAVVALAGLLASPAARAATYGELTYTSDGSAITIIDCASTATNVVVPETIAGLPVTKIGDNAFYGCASLTSVSFGNNVTNIGSAAFYQCYGLSHLVFGDSVTSIQEDAFAFCRSLTNVVLKDSLISIEHHAFAYCSGLSEIVLPNNVTSVELRTFYRCTSLTNVILGSAITNVDSRSFQFCENLAHISVDPANSYYTDIDGILFNNDETSLVLFPGARTGSYTIPGSVSNIAEQAFFTTRLSIVNISENVSGIGESAFQQGTNLTAITVDAANPDFMDLDGVLFNKDQTLIMQYPAGMTESSYTIPTNVLNIGKGAFTKSYHLSDVVIPNTVTNFGRYAFEDAHISSIAIPDSVRNIEDYAFIRCTNLNTAVIGQSVTNLGKFAFNGCTSLTNIYFTGDSPNLGSHVFSISSSTAVYYLPGTSGWGATYASLPTALWNPMMGLGPDYGATTNGFSFNITGTADIPVRIEACTNLAEGAWMPLHTTALSGGSLDFSDADWNSHPTRIYRITGP